MTWRWRWWASPSRVVSTSSGRSIDHQLSCATVVTLLVDFLDDGLDEATRAQFDAHLRTCEGCTGHVDQFRTAVSILADLQPASLREAIRVRLLAALEGSPPSPDP